MYAEPYPRTDTLAANGTPDCRCALPRPPHAGLAVLIRLYQRDQDLFDAQTDEVRQILCRQQALPELDSEPSSLMRCSHG